MPYSQTEPSLPFSGRAPRARQNSYRAAVDASVVRVHKAHLYLNWLRVGKFGATDHDAAEHFGWPLSSICSIRNGLGPLVTDVGDCIGKYGKRVTVWGPRGCR